MNILVTGSNGQLGRKIRELCHEDGKDSFLFADIVPEHRDGSKKNSSTDCIGLDICDKEAVEAVVRENDVQMIVNCAAYTDVEKAEDDFQNAMKVNAFGPKVLAGVMAARGGTLIHISTDYVFGDVSFGIPIKEDEPKNPLSAYGKSKSLGEDFIAESGCKALIFRTAWMYSEHGRNFFKTISRLIAEKPEVKVVDDQIGSPTYAGDLAAAIVQIIRERKFKGKEGVYHYSGAGQCSWFELAREIASLTGCEDRVKPCSTEEYPTRAVRPKYSVLDKSKFVAAFGIEIPQWQDSLKICACKVVKRNEYTQ